MFQWLKTKCLRKRKFYKDADFKCKCGCGMLPTRELMDFAENVAQGYGAKLRINSAARCKNHNMRVGGSPGSQHLLGKAVDFGAPLGSMRDEIVKIAAEHGVKGIGIYPAWGVHLDVRDGSPARWNG